MESGAAWYRVRRRIGSVILIALLAALVGGVCATAVAGARRTATAGDRLHRAGREPDGLIFADNVDPSTWPRIAQLPSVARAGRVAYLFTFPLADPDNYYPMLVSMDGIAGRDLFRGHLIAGRYVDPDADDEVVLAETNARRLHLRPGDELRLGSYSPAASRRLSLGRDADADGPHLTLRVVGITRSTEDLLVGPRDPVVTLLPRSISDRLGDEVGRNDGIFLVDLRRDDLDRLGAELRQAYPIGEVPGVDPGGLSVSSLDDSLGVLASGLYAFAAVAGVFGAAAIALAVARHVARSEPDQLILSSVGMTRRERFTDAWLALVVAAACGATGAVVLAVAASSRMPVGLGRRVDPDLGVHVDVPILVSVALVTAGLVAGAGALSAWRIANRSVTVSARTIAPTRTRRGLGRLAVRQWPSMAVGLDLAQPTGRRPEATAIRTATAGMVVALVGIAAVAVFGASMDRLLDSPDRYGWGWTATVREGAPPTTSQLLADPDVEAVARGVFNTAVEIDGESLTAMALDPVSGEVGPVMIDGRAPQADDEVALAADSARADGHPHTVSVVDADGHSSVLRVVGTFVMPAIEDPIPIAEGAFFTYHALDELGFAHPSIDSPGGVYRVVVLRDGADPESVLRVSGGPDDAISVPRRPPEIQRLDQVSTLPRVLVAFLAALALLAVGNALWQSQRRRRRELGVLRALGFDRRQVGGTLAWQGAALAVLASLVGLPLGIALGRMLWSVVARNLGVAEDPLTPVIVLALAPLTIVLAAGAGAGFGVAASRRPAAGALRDD